MKEYVLQRLNNKEYDGFLLCLTFENILNYMASIENEAMISGTKGLLLVDQLLVTGNGKNRFMLCPFEYGKVDISAVKNIYPSEYYKKLAGRLLLKNYTRLHNSILTDQQLSDVKNGVVI